MKSAKTVDEYIANAPKDLQERLTQLRGAIKQAAPDALEKISYGMPYYGYKGRLAYFRYATKHIGLYIMPPVLKEHKDELTGYVTSKATIQFPLEKELPVALIKKLIKTGIRTNDGTIQ